MVVANVTVRLWYEGECFSKICGMLYTLLVPWTNVAIVLER